MGTYDEYKLACPPDYGELQECGAGCGSDDPVKERVVDGQSVLVCRSCAQSIDVDAEIEAAEAAERVALRPHEAAVMRLADDLGRALEMLP